MHPTMLSDGLSFHLQRNIFYAPINIFLINDIIQLFLIYYSIRKSMNPSNKIKLSVLLTIAAFPALSYAVFCLNKIKGLFL